MAPPALSNCFFVEKPYGVPGVLCKPDPPRNLRTHLALLKSHQGLSPSAEFGAFLAPNEVEGPAVPLRSQAILLATNLLKVVTLKARLIYTPACCAGEM